MKYLSAGLWLALAGSALSGCAVYMPATPSTPLVRSTHESEITAEMSPGVFEGSVAYVPAANLLVVAEGSLHSAKGDPSPSNNNSGTTSAGGIAPGGITIGGGTLENVHMRAGAGIGTYRLLGRDASVYLGIVAGMGAGSASIYGGQGRAAAGSSQGNFTDFLFTGDQLARYEASYRYYYHQVYVAKTTQRFSYGASLRSTYVHYSELMRDQVPISSPTSFYIEPTLFVRYGPRAYQGQIAAGFSQPNAGNGNSPDQPYVSPTNLILNFSVVLRPQLLPKRKTKAKTK